MKKLIIFLTFCICSISIFAKENVLVQKQNVLYIQNMIKIEENIAKQVERYILQEYKIPTLADLQVEEYLGKNFTLNNRFGSDISLNIDFSKTPSFRINYAISSSKLGDYKNALYERDLYRELTTVYYDEENYSNSYISFDFKSQSAKRIASILKASFSIEKKCSGSALKSVYCMVNTNTIRWYTADSNWIEYDIEKFDRGNISVNVESMLSNTKVKDIKIGSFVFLENGSKYLKTNTQILKVQ